MIRQAKESDKKELLEVMYNSIEENLYLYIDILIYGIETEFLQVWIQEQDNYVQQIVMKYYDSFQIYSCGPEYDDVIILINKFKPKMISGSEKTIQEIYKSLNNEYDSDYGVVLEQKKIDCHVEYNIVETATIDDMTEIAELICMDEGIGGHYIVENLRNQLVKRFVDKMSRNYIIKDENTITAHYATYAESDNTAVLGGLIVHPSNRRKGYAKMLHSYVSNLMIFEDKRVFLFCHDKDVLKMYEKLGANIVSKYGKLTLK